MEKENLVVQFTLSKESVTSLMYLMGTPLTDYVWSKLSNEVLELDTDLLGNKQQLEFVIASCAVAKVYREMIDMGVCPTCNRDLIYLADPMEDHCLKCGLVQTSKK